MENIKTIWVKVLVTPLNIKGRNELVLSLRYLKVSDMRKEVVLPTGQCAVGFSVEQCQ